MPNRKAFLPAVVLITVILAAIPSAFGQQANAPSSSSKTSSSRNSVPEYCDQELAFCVTLPTGWTEIGDAYEGKAVIFAPPQEGDQSLWAQVTIAGTETLTKEGQDSTSLEDLVTVLVGHMATQAKNVRTERRSEIRIGDRPAQLVEVRYDDSGHTWAEILAIVDAGQGQFYTIAFKSLAEQRNQYQPAVDELLRTFRIIE